MDRIRSTKESATMRNKFTAFAKPLIGKFVLAAGVLATAMVAMPRPASADTQSTAAIVAAAALIAGAIAYDSNGQPYYVREGRCWYVRTNVANYYQREYGWNGGPGYFGNMDRGRNQRGFHDRRSGDGRRPH
jgi:hypothetical protein